MANQILLTINLLVLIIAVIYLNRYAHRIDKVDKLIRKVSDMSKSQKNNAEKSDIEKTKNNIQGRDKHGRFTKISK